MAKKIYVGVGDVAKNVKKVYVGVNGTARRVKKAYVGVDGVAKLCFSSNTLQFVGFTNNKEYGVASTSKDGNSLYLNVSGTAPYGIPIDAGYNLTDMNGILYKIPSGSTITFTMRYEKAASYNLACLRLADMDGNYTYPYSGVNVTNQTFTVTKESYLMFLAECGYGGSVTEYVKLWIDSFIINGEKII